MQTVTYETPVVYGDHHVIEVRRILSELPGVKEVYVSSAFHVIQVAYDPKKINDKEIAKKLEAAGYLGEIPMLVETGIAVEKVGNDAFFRHTASYETIKTTVSFAQRVDHDTVRPLWPCPGMVPVKKTEE